MLSNYCIFMQMFAFFPFTFIFIFLIPLNPLKCVQEKSEKQQIN